MGRRKHSRRELSLDDIPPPPPPVEEVDWNTQIEEVSAFLESFDDKDELDVAMEGPYSPHRHQYQPQMQSRSLGVNREYNEVALTESDPKYSDNPEYSDKVIIEEEEEEQDRPSLEYHQRSSGILSRQPSGLSLGVDTAITGRTAYDTSVEVKTTPHLQQIEESFRVQQE